MGADLWSVCPVCEKEHQKTVDDIYMTGAALYGEVPAEEWLEYMKALHAVWEEKVPETLAQYLEMYLEDNVLTYSFKAYCHVCKFTFVLNRTKVNILSGNRL